MISLLLSQLVVSKPSPPNHHLSGLGSSWLEERCRAWLDGREDGNRGGLFAFCGADDSATDLSLPPATLGQAFAAHPNTPAVMACAGTGLAPFAGLLRARLAAVNTLPPPPPAVLVYGCRTAGDDMIYRDLLAACLETGVLTLVRVAASGEAAGCTFPGWEGTVCSGAHVQDVLSDAGDGDLQDLVRHCAAGWLAVCVCVCVCVCVGSEGDPKKQPGPSGSIPTCAHTPRGPRLDRF